MNNLNLPNTKIIFFWFYLLAVLMVSTNPAQAATTSCQSVSSTNKTDFVGEASIVFFYFGDDDEITTLAQESVELSKAFQSMKYKVLLYDSKESVGSKFLSAKALSQANDVLLPTQENLFKSIHELTDAGYVLNIWIFSHGSSYTNSKGEEITYFKAADGNITSKEITTEFAAKDGCSQLPIRMVYSLACYHNQLNDEWTALGAKVTAGARYINFYPTQFDRFASDWNQGITYEKALSNSNTDWNRFLTQAYLTALSWQYANHGSCGSIPNILGQTNCAEWFFTGGGPYDLGDDYNPSKSGAANMDYSSYKIIKGDRSVTKTKALTWQMQ